MLVSQIVQYWLLLVFHLKIFQNHVYKGAVYFDYLNCQHKIHWDIKNRCTSQYIFLLPIKFPGLFLFDKFFQEMISLQINSQDQCHRILLTTLHWHDGILKNSSIVFDGSIGSKCSWTNPTSLKRVELIK